MTDYLFQILRLLRPRQWTKNLALFAAIVFGGQLFNQRSLSQVIVGFVAFCLLSSSTYIINDLLDYKKDILHPFKRMRPIASGKIRPGEGILLFFFFATLSLLIGQNLGSLFVTMEITYLFMQIAYSYFFKGLAVFDILFIASGYILRVLAGEVISGFHISAWLLLTTISLSLFLAVGKRRSELTLLVSTKSSHIAAVRQSLSHYSDRLLDVFATMFATSTFIFYTMFTFLENPTGVRISVPLLLPDFLPPYLQRKWLMITIFPVVYGLMRYLQDIYERSEGESPERILLSDKPLLVNVIIWIIMVIFVMYILS